MKELFSLPTAKWLETLQSPTSTITVDLANYVFRSQRSKEWDTGNMRLTMHLLYFAVESSFTAQVGSHQFLAPSGSLIWICPETVFRFRSRPGKAGPTIARVRFSVTEADTRCRPSRSFYVLENAWDQIPSLQRLAQEVEHPGPYAKWKIKSELCLLSAKVFERTHSRETGQTVFNDEIREKISLLSQSDPAARIKPEELARQLGFSPDYFTRLFRRSYGVPPKTWLLKQRLRHAAAMLREPGIRISEVAEAHGYTDLYLFSRQFRKEFGRSPSEWRQIRRATDFV